MTVVSSRISRKQYFLCCSHQHCCLLVITLLCCAVLYLPLWQLFSSASPSSLKATTWPGHRDLAATPFVDFIDPDLGYLQRMFYSGGLVSEARSEPAFASRSGAERTPQPAGYNITVFHGQADQHHNTCVPFYVPGNRTLRICVYERVVDQMISASLQDNGVWEKEQVEGMADLLRRDDANINTTLSVQALRGGQYVEHADHFEVRHSLTMSAPGSGREDKTWDSRLSVVDVGCNVGVYTLAAASLGHKVLALDPVLSNLELLDTSLRLASLREHVTLLLNAVSDLPGPVHVHINPSNVGGSFVSHSQTSRSRTQQNLLSVWALCLDHLVPLVPTRRLFLKLDIEGWEARILRCSADFFQQLDVRYVLMEWLFFRHRHTGVDIINFMIRNGLLPYSDATQTTVLNPNSYYSWPDNVWWMKR